MMSHLARALLAALVFLTTSPAAASVDYVDEHFEDGVDVFNDHAWGMNPLDEGHLSKGLQSVIPVGEHWGSSGHWYFEDHGYPEPDEIYWRYWIKFPSGFYIEPPNRGKLPGPAGLYNYRCLGNRASTPEEPCFSSRMLFSRTYPPAGEPGYPNGPDDKTRIGFYTYHLDSPDHRGDIWPWDENEAILDHGKWYCVEGRIKLNTPGLRDGILTGWVNGQEAFDKSDIAFRRSAESWLHIKSFWFDVYYGGDESVNHNEIHFDSLAISSGRVGCAEYEGTFFDDDHSVFEADIEWAAETGVTKGCNPPDNNMFCPEDEVTRGQMAAFLSRYLNLPPASKDYFTDDDGTTFEADINRLAEARITTGCAPDRYCPEAFVTRGQIAAFLARAFGLADDGGGDLFMDDDSSTFESDIDKLSTSGITRGCNPPENDRFCPTEAVTRGAMAAFLHRAPSP